MSVVVIVSVHIKLNIWLWITIFRKEKKFFFASSKKTKWVLRKVNFGNLLWIRWIIDLVASQMLPLGWTWFRIYLFRGQTERICLQTLLVIQTKIEWWRKNLKQTKSSIEFHFWNTTSHLIWDWISAGSHEQKICNRIPIENVDRKRRLLLTSINNAGLKWHSKNDTICWSMISTSIWCSCCNTSHFLTFNIMTLQRAQWRFFFISSFCYCKRAGYCGCTRWNGFGQSHSETWWILLFFFSVLNVSLFSHIWHLRCRHSKIRILFAEKSSRKIIHTRFTGLRSFHGKIKKVCWSTRVPYRREKNIFVKNLSAKMAWIRCK